MGVITGYKSSKALLKKYEKHLLTDETSEITALKLAFDELKKAQDLIIRKDPSSALQRIKFAAQNLERVAAVIEQDKRRLNWINTAISNNYKNQ